MGYRCESSENEFLYPVKTLNRFPLTEPSDLYLNLLNTSLFIERPSLGVSRVKGGSVSRASTTQYIMDINKDKIILHLCADIGSDSKPYREAGYDVRLIGSKIGVENYHPPKNVYGIIANPPCTHFSIARSRAKTPRDLEEGMRLVKECLRIIWECQYPSEGNRTKSNLKFWAIENPQTGALKNFLGHPTFSYSPHEFGADYSKQTALWGLFTPPRSFIPMRLSPSTRI